MQQPWLSDQEYEALLLGKSENPSVLHMEIQTNSPIKLLVEEALACSQQNGILALVHSDQAVVPHQFDPAILQLAEYGIYYTEKNSKRIYHPRNSRLAKEGFVIERKRHVYDEPSLVTVLSGSLLVDCTNPIELTVLRIAQCPQGLLKIEITPLSLPPEATIMSIAGLSEELDGTVQLEQVRPNLLYVHDMFTSDFVGAEEVLYDAQNGEGPTNGPHCEVNFSKSLHCSFVHLMRGSVKLPSFGRSSQSLQSTRTTQGEPRPIHQPGLIPRGGINNYPTGVYPPTVDSSSRGYPNEHEESSAGPLHNQGEDSYERRMESLSRLKVPALEHQRQQAYAQNPTSTVQMHPNHFGQDARATQNPINMLGAIPNRINQINPPQTGGADPSAANLHLGANTFLAPNQAQTLLSGSVHPGPTVFGSQGIAGGPLQTCAKGPLHPQGSNTQSEPVVCNMGPTLVSGPNIPVQDHLSGSITSSSVKPSAITGTQSPHFVGNNVIQTDNSSLGGSESACTSSSLDNCIGPFLERKICVIVLASDKSDGQLVEKHLSSHGISAKFPRAGKSKSESLMNYIDEYRVLILTPELLYNSIEKNGQQSLLRYCGVLVVPKTQPKCSIPLFAKLLNKISPSTILVHYYEGLSSGIVSSSSVNMEAIMPVSQQNQHMGVPNAEIGLRHPSLPVAHFPTPEICRTEVSQEDSRFLRNLGRAIVLSVQTIAAALGPGIPCNFPGIGDVMQGQRTLGFGQWIQGVLSIVCERTDLQEAGLTLEFMKKLDSSFDMSRHCGWRCAVYLLVTCAIESHGRSRILFEKVFNQVSASLQLTTDIPDPIDYWAWAPRIKRLVDYLNEIQSRYKSNKVLIVVNSASEAQMLFKMLQCATVGWTILDLCGSLHEVRSDSRDWANPSNVQSEKIDRFNSRIGYAALIASFPIEVPIQQAETVILYSVSLDKIRDLAIPTHRLICFKDS